jgi:hypothetical protein
MSYLNAEVEVEHGRHWLPLCFTEALAAGALICLLLATSPARVAQAQEVQFRPGQLIYAGAAPLGVRALRHPVRG